VQSLKTLKAPVFSALSLIAYSGSALACATCFAASSPRALRGFYLSAALLLSAPFVIVAILVFVLRQNLAATGPLDKGDESS